jgi:hypothetical protein
MRSGRAPHIGPRSLSASCWRPIAQTRIRRGHRLPRSRAKAAATRSVDAMGAVLSDWTLRRRRGKRPRLTPTADGERTRQIVRPQQPGGAGLADLEPVPVEGRRSLQAPSFRACRAATRDRSRRAGPAPAVCSLPRGRAGAGSRSAPAEARTRGCGGRVRVPDRCSRVASARNSRPIKRTVPRQFQHLRFREKPGDPDGPPTEAHRREPRQSSSLLSSSGRGTCFRLCRLRYDGLKSTRGRRKSSSLACGIEEMDR